MGIYTADYFSGWEMAQKATEIRGQTDTHCHLFFLAISPIPIPLLHRPSYQNKIVISAAEASPFYWRLSDGRVIMSNLGFDRPTRERLVLQEQSMTLGHIPINRLPQLFLLMLPTPWQIRCFIRKKKEKKIQGNEEVGEMVGQKNVKNNTQWVILTKHLIVMFNLHIITILLKDKSKHKQCKKAGSINPLLQYSG